MARPWSAGRSGRPAGGSAELVLLGGAKLGVCRLLRPPLARRAHGAELGAAHHDALPVDLMTRAVAVLLRHRYSLFTARCLHAEPFMVSDTAGQSCEKRSRGEVSGSQPTANRATGSVRGPVGRSCDT